MKTNDKLAIGGRFYVEHYRDGELLDRQDSANIVVDEGLVYALNSAFGVAVGGAPSPLPQIYIGLSQANRAWQATDVAATINTVANEFQTYDEAARPPWSPQALATISLIELNDLGAEATYTIGDLSGVGGSANIYGGFMISSAAKDGSQDAAATLIAGSNFNNVRQVFPADVLKVGYILKAENKV